jgi:hypothetical protein
MAENTSGAEQAGRVSAEDADRLRELIGGSLDAVRNGETAVVAELEEAYVIATRLRPQSRLLSDHQRDELVAQASRSLAAASNEELLEAASGDGHVDIVAVMPRDAVAQLRATADPELRVVLAVRDAARATDAHAWVLLHLCGAFLAGGRVIEGDGEVLRVEQWPAITRSSQSSGSA